MSRKLNNKIFLNECNEVHNNKYDYSLVEYKKAKDKIKIICPIHGIFEQNAFNHKKGIGCPKCSYDKLRNINFIEESNKIHNNKYDYSLIKYKNNRTKIKIICFKHGVFEQVPQSHLNGFGCKKCSIENRENWGGGHGGPGWKPKHTKEKFIKKSIKVHGNKYDYSLVDYNGSDIKIKIICSIHGIFEQTPRHHLYNRGCPKCSIDSKKDDTNKFIEKSIKVHGNKYDYSLVDYKSYNEFVKIICSEHGVFKQLPKYHVSGSGCPKCCYSKNELLIENFLNKNNIIFEREKRFEKCKNKYTLPFDFYLPKFNMCIEYDGEHHYKPIDYWGGEENLKKIKKRDNIKNIYCSKNNINLMRIKYNENIKNKLDKINEKKKNKNRKQKIQTG